MKYFGIMLSCFFIFLAYTSSAESTTTYAQTISVRIFVQKFYNWYVPKALNGNSSMPWELVLKEKSTELSPQLFQALTEDVAAQKKVIGEINGLDFDPFLNSQDPYQHYEVGNVIAKNNSYWADVYGVEAGRKNRIPDVVTELVWKNGRWIFVNFHYPKAKDLITVLKLLAAERR